MLFKVDIHASYQCSLPICNIKRTAAFSCPQDGLLERKSLPGITCEDPRGLRVKTNHSFPSGCQCLVSASFPTWTLHLALKSVALEEFFGTSVQLSSAAPCRFSWNAVIPIPAVSCATVYSIVVDVLSALAGQELIKHLIPIMMPQVSLR